MSTFFLIIWLIWCICCWLIWQLTVKLTNSIIHSRLEFSLTSKIFGDGSTDLQNLNFMNEIGYTWNWNRHFVITQYKSLMKYIRQSKEKKSNEHEVLFWVSTRHFTIRTENSTAAFCIFSMFQFCLQTSKRNSNDEYLSHASIYDHSATLFDTVLQVHI